MAETGMAEVVDKPTKGQVKEKKAKATKVAKVTKETKKAKEVKVPNEKKEKIFPSYTAMIVEAITALEEKTGSSPQAIAKYLEAKHTGLPLNFKKKLGFYLKKFTGSKLEKVKSSFKLISDKKTVKKPKAAPVVEEKVKPIKEKKIVDKKVIEKKSPEKKVAEKKSNKKKAEPVAETVDEMLDDSAPAATEKEAKKGVKKPSARKTAGKKAVTSPKPKATASPKKGRKPSKK